MALNILIVDDSSVMRAMIKKTLHLSGLILGEIHEAGNGKEGLAVLGKTWIDLALVDINMPVMDGEEMLKRIRQDPEIKDLPVIIVSTEGSDTRIEMLQRKCARFVHKPFTPEILRETVINILGGKLDEEKLGEGTVLGSGPDF